MSVQLNSILPDGDDLVPGGSLVIRMTATNSGPALAELFDPERSDPLSYEFRTPAGEHVAAVSERLYRTQTLPWPPEPTIPGTIPVLPGASVVHEQDVARFFVEPLQSGEYDCIATCEMVHDEAMAAPPVRVQIPELEARRVVVGHHGGGARWESGYALFHEGELRLLQRESAEGLPNTGVAYERHRLASAERLRDLAVAADMGVPQDWRYFAWLEEDAIAATVAWGGRILRRISPRSLGLEAPRFLGSGWQMHGGKGRFVVGGRQDGKPMVQVVDMSGIEVTDVYAFETVFSELPPVLGTWAHEPEVIDLVRGRWDGQGTTLEVDRLDLRASTQLRAAHTLASRPGRLRALSMAPVLVGKPMVDALFEEPPDAEGRLTGLMYLRCGLFDGSIEQWHVPLPIGATPEVWSIAAIPHVRAPILLCGKDRLWTGTAREFTEWTPWDNALTPRPLAHLLHLTAPTGEVNGSVFLAWYEPTRGLLTQVLVGDES